MRLRSSWILFILLLTGFGAGCDDGRQDVLLADFEFEAKDAFSTSTRDSVPNHLHRFGEGFSHVGSAGRWTLGDEAHLHLHVLGSRVLLEIDCSTTPEMSEQEQAVNLSWNGYDLGTHPVVEGWKRVMVVGRVPAIAVEQGMNEIVLRPTVVQDTTGGKRPLGVFIKGLRLRAELGADEIEELQRAREVAEHDQGR